MQKTVILKNTASAVNIKEDYRPIIDGVIHVLREYLKDTLVEIRLLGSVARGTAIPGCSDIDFLAVTGPTLSQIDLERLKHLVGAIPFDTALLPRIDMQYMSADSIDRHVGYRLIVMTDSVCIFGEDHYTVSEYPILNTELADLWTPDIDKIIADYRKALSSPDISEADRIKYSRLTGKDIMKCFQRRVLLEYGLIERSVEKIYRNLVHYIPTYSGLFDKLWRLYQAPCTDIQYTLGVLHECEQAKGEIMSNEIPRQPEHTGG